MKKNNKNLSIYKYENDIKLDFLTIKIDPLKLGIVLNSNVLHLDHGFVLTLDMSNNSFSTFNIKDMNDNLLINIMTVTDNNKRFDFYNKATFYGTFFNLYYEYLNYFFDILNIKYENDVMRFDLKIDIDGIGVDDFTWCYSGNLTKHSYDSVNNNYLRRTSPKRYKFRIYNKLKDILDKKLYMIKDNDDYKKYGDLLHGHDVLTRVELEVGRKLIVEKNITLSNVFNYKFIQKLYFDYYKVNISGEKLIRTKKTEIEKEYNKELTLAKKLHTKAMLSAYLKKSLDLFLDQPQLFYDVFNDLDYIQQQNLKLLLNNFIKK